MRGLHPKPFVAQASHFRLTRAVGWCRGGVYGQTGGQGDEARLGELRRRHGAPGLRLKCTAFVPQLAHYCCTEACVPACTGGRTTLTSRVESTHREPRSKSRLASLRLQFGVTCSRALEAQHHRQQQLVLLSTGRRPPEARVSKEDHAVREPRATTLASIAGKGRRGGGAADAADVGLQALRRGGARSAAEEGPI